MPWLPSLSENIVSYSVGRFYTECVNSTFYQDFFGMEIMDEKRLNHKEIKGFSRISRNASKQRSVNLRLDLCVLCKFCASILAVAFSLTTAAQQFQPVCTKSPHKSAHAANAGEGGIGRELVRLKRRCARVPFTAVTGDFAN